MDLLNSICDKIAVKLNHKGYIPHHQIGDVTGLLVGLLRPHITVKSEAPRSAAAGPEAEPQWPGIEVTSANYETREALTHNLQTALNLGWKVEAITESSDMSLERYTMILSRTKPAEAPESGYFKKGDKVTFGSSDATYEVADPVGRGGLVGIYDEPPGKHIDYVHPGSLKHAR